METKKTVKTKSGIEVEQRVIFGENCEYNLYTQVRGFSFSYEEQLEEKYSRLLKSMPKGLEISEREKEIALAFLLAKVMVDNEDNAKKQEEEKLKNILVSKDMSTLLAIFIRQEGERVAEGVLCNRGYSGSERNIKLIQMLLTIDFWESEQELVENRILKEFSDLKSSKLKSLYDDIEKAVMARGKNNEGHKFSLSFRKKLWGMHKFIHSDILKKEWAEEFAELPKLGVGMAYPWLKGEIKPGRSAFSFLLDAQLWLHDDFGRKMDVFFNLMEETPTNSAYAELFADAYLMILPLLISAPKKYRERAQNLIKKWQKEAVLKYSLCAYEFDKLEEMYGIDADVDEAIDVFLEKICCWKPVRSFDCDDRDKIISVHDKCDAEKILDTAKKIKLPEYFITYCNKCMENHKALIESAYRWDAEVDKTNTFFIHNH